MLSDEVGGLLGPTVDQDIAVAADDQDRRDAAGSDEVSVPVDPNRRRGLGPVIRSVARHHPSGTRAFDRRTWLLDHARLAERDDELGS